MAEWHIDHVRRIRAKAENADGLGPFWKEIMLAACDQILTTRKRADKFGLALMMIGEGAENPREFAQAQLVLHGRATEDVTQPLSSQSARG